MGFVLADGGLAPWGQAAAFIIALYVFISIVVGLVLVAALMFLLAWLREKSELIKKLRPMVNELNQALEAAQRGDPLPAEMADNKFVRTVAQVPKVAATLPAKASNIEQKVEQGSDRVAGAVIEFRARTQQAKGIAKALFLPGLTRRRVVTPAEQRAQAEQVAQAERERVTEVAREEPPLEQEIVITQSSR
jgi:uncharacterized membrane protein YccC